MAAASVLATYGLATLEDFKKFDIKIRACRHFARRKSLWKYCLGKIVETISIYCICSNIGKLGVAIQVGIS